MKRYFTLLQILEPGPHHQFQFSITPRIPLFAGGVSPLQGIQSAYIQAPQLQLTEIAETPRKYVFVLLRHFGKKDGSQKLTFKKKIFITFV